MEVLALVLLRKTTKARNKLVNSSIMHRASREYSRTVECARAAGIKSPPECEVTRGVSVVTGGVEAVGMDGIEHLCIVV